jgi:tripartite-type tricarboxylate transporter receptor subunit TctC
MGRFTLLAPILSAALTVCFAGGATAQQVYPTHTVRFIVPFGAASATDVTARMFADRLAARWGKAVVVENRPGGEGVVAVETFVAAHDDHTLFFGPVGTFTVQPYQHDTLPYDTQRDLVPIVGVSEVSLAISTPAALNIDSIDQLVARAKAEPGKLNAAAASGISDFLLFGWIKSMDLQIVKVPYRDIMQAPNDLAEGRIQVLSSSLAVVQALAQAGRIKVLAVAGQHRAPTMPEVPTAIEAGYPALAFEAGGGLFGPRGMADALRDSIAADVRKIAEADPVIAARLADTSQILIIRGPAEFAADIQQQRDQLAAIAKSLGLKAAQ